MSKPTSFYVKFDDANWELQVSANANQRVVVRLWKPKVKPLELSLELPDRLFGPYDFFAQEHGEAYIYGPDLLRTIQKNDWVRDTGRITFGKQGEKIRIFEICHPELQALVDLARP